MGCNGEVIWAPYVKWETSTVSISADEAVAAMAGDSEGRSATEEAKAFLLEVLSEGPVEAKEIKRQAGEIGFSIASLRRAQRFLGVEAYREGGIADKGQWLWRLSPVPKMSKVLTSEVEHLRHLSGRADGTNSETANVTSSNGDGDPFASFNDASLKLKLEPEDDDYPELPKFLDRRATQG
jgi:hypothetical protein